MTRLKTNALRTISAAMLISVLAAVTGCSDRKPDIDYDLIHQQGGDNSGADSPHRSPESNGRAAVHHSFYHDHKA